MFRCKPDNLTEILDSLIVFRFAHVRFGTVGNSLCLRFQGWEAPPCSPIDSRGSPVARNYRFRVSRSCEWELLEPTINPRLAEKPCDVPSRNSKVYVLGIG